MEEISPIFYQLNFPNLEPNSTEVEPSFWVCEESQDSLIDSGIFSVHDDYTLCLKEIEEMNILTNKPSMKHSENIATNMEEKVQICENQLSRELKPDTIDLFSLRMSLDKFKEVSFNENKSRLEKWTFSSPNMKKSIFLVHVTEVESDVIHFQKYLVSRVLQKDFGLVEAQKNNTKWKSCEEFIVFHRENFRKTLFESKKLTERIVNQIGANEESSYRREDINGNLMLLAYLLFSAKNSYKQIALNEKEAKKFEMFHYAVVNCIFLHFIPRKDSDTAPACKLQSFLSNLNSKLDNWISETEEAEFDIVDNNLVER